MKDQPVPVVRLEITMSSLFGDGINGRPSEPGRFKVNGIEFISIEPTCRREAIHINHTMTELRKALEHGQRSTP